MKTGLILGSEPHKFGAIALDKYVVSAAPQVPATVETPGKGIYSWGMLGNDTYGDCVPVSLYHADESLYLKRGLQPYPYQTPECEEFYFTVNGVQPGPPGSASDQGTDPSVAMAYWRDKGLPGHKLAGFGSLPANSPNIRRAIWEFGAVIFAVALPSDWQTQVDSTGAHWRGSNHGQGVDGHGIVANGYTPDLYEIVTWGQEGDLDNAYASAYLEQVFVPLSHDALNSAGVGPAGFDYAAMTKDLPSPQ